MRGYPSCSIFYYDLLVVVSKVGPANSSEYAVVGSVLKKVTRYLAFDSTSDVLRVDVPFYVSYVDASAGEKVHNPSLVSFPRLSKNVFYPFIRY